MMKRIATNKNWKNWKYFYFIS